MKKALLVALLLIPIMGQRNMVRLEEYGVILHAIMPDGQEANGSGVFIENNLILSAKHLYFEGARYFTDKEHTVEVVVVKVDTGYDLMLLYADGKHKYAKLGPTPKKLDVVYTVGYPLGATQVVVIGRIADVSKGHILVDTTAVQGMSGGGIYNEDGRLVGIVSRSWGNEKFMVAPDSSAIKAFLGANLGAK